ncbi:MAG: restriction endonuclease subunit S [Bacteroidota bacterium]|jgi:type I restriction enzyme S subunit
MSVNSKKTKWVRLGDYIEELDVRNSDNKIKKVKSVSVSKEFKETNAKVNKEELRGYKLVPPYHLSYVQTTKNEKCFANALNTTNETYVVTQVNKVLFAKSPDDLNIEYLSLIFKNEEFDRYAIFNSWGSARETLDWSVLCDTLIPLPSPEVQQELVDTYNGLKALAEQNEALIKPLTEACQAYIVDCKKKYPEVELGEYLDFHFEKNSDCQITLEQGINIDKVFINPHRPNSDLSSRIIVRKGQFAYCTQLNNENVAIAYREDDDCVVSPVYKAFEIKQEYKNQLLPKYLFLWLKRQEFGRYVYWRSVGSAYEFLQEENIREYRIPIPSPELQQAIVNIYNCAEEAKKIAAEAREKMKTLCPALVQRAIHS